MNHICYGFSGVTPHLAHDGRLVLEDGEEQLVRDDTELLVHEVQPRVLRHVAELENGSVVKEQISRDWDRTKDEKQ